MAGLPLSFLPRMVIWDNFFSPPKRPKLRFWRIFKRAKYDQVVTLKRSEYSSDAWTLKNYDYVEIAERFSLMGLWTWNLNGSTQVSTDRVQKEWNWEIQIRKQCLGYILGLYKSLDVLQSWVEPNYVLQAHILDLFNRRNRKRHPSWRTGEHLSWRNGDQLHFQAWNLSRKSQSWFV